MKNNKRKKTEDLKTKLNVFDVIDKTTKTYVFCKIIYEILESISLMFC